MSLYAYIHIYKCVCVCVEESQCVEVCVSNIHV